MGPTLGPATSDASKAGRTATCRTPTSSPPRSLRLFPWAPSRRRAPEPNCRIRSLRGILSLHLRPPPPLLDVLLAPILVGFFFLAHFLSHIEPFFGDLGGLFCSPVLITGTKVFRDFRKLQRVFGCYGKLSFQSLNIRWTLRNCGAGLAFFWSHFRRVSEECVGVVKGKEVFGGVGKLRIIGV